MKIEQIISQELNKYPLVKRYTKKVYQLFMYAVSKKIKSEGNVICLSGEDIYRDYFFGYYDKSPEDASGRYILCLRTEKNWKETAPKKIAEILLIDRKEKVTKVVGNTHCWNVQQGCMLQWLGPDYDREIIYNDFRNGKFCSVILDVFSGRERELSVPIYSVSEDGKYALTLDFTRLHRLRPGYGYSNIEEKTQNEKCPNATCIWRVDIASGKVDSILSYKDLYNFEPRIEMKDAEHKVNHIMISPNGKRFMFIHRWFNGNRKYSRLITINIDGTEMYNMLDENMVSHCNWKDDDTIISFANKFDEGIGYYLLRDKTEIKKRLWKNVHEDGHPSYSPDKKYVLTDTYPNRERMASIRIIDNENVKTVARVFAPFIYDGETRCDLHPRWSRDGKRIYFDSTHEGNRRMYMVDDSNFKSNKMKISVVMCSYNGEKFVREQLDSILKQSIKPNEIVIYDDSSTDKTCEILEEYVNKYKDIEFIINKNEKNIGFILNFMQAIKSATGDIIFIADQDDIWYSNKVEENIKVFNKYEDALAVNSAYDLINSKGKLIKKRFVYNIKKTRKEIKKIDWYDFILSPRYPGMSLVIKKELLDHIGNINSENIPAHDWLLNEAASHNQGMYYLNKKLTGYRQHGDNTVGVTNTNDKNKLLKNREHSLHFLKKTHYALSELYGEDEEIYRIAYKLMKIDLLREENVREKSLMGCICTYIVNYKYISLRCFMADCYTILKCKIT